MRQKIRTSVNGVTPKCLYKGMKLYVQSKCEGFGAPKRSLTGTFNRDLSDFFWKIQLNILYYKIGAFQR